MVAYDDLNNQILYSTELKEELFKAVKRCDTKKVNILKDKVLEVFLGSHLGILGRSKSRLRAIKNILLSFNTLYCYAAEKGGLSTITLHYKAESYAIMIEQSNTEEEAVNTFYTFISDYADPKNRKIFENNLSESIINYIKNSFTNNISIDSIASEFGLNKSYMMRKFKKDTGKTIQQEIIDKRISEACRLLENTSIKVIDISNMIGFNSDTYFCSAFKKIKGMNPGDYRKLKANSEN